MGKIHPRRKENGRCLPAGSWNRSPPVSNLLLTIQEATRLEKVCVWGAGVWRYLPDAMDRAGGVSEAPRDQVQGAGGDMRRQSGEAESNLEKV